MQSLLTIAERRKKKEKGTNINDTASKSICEQVRLYNRLVRHSRYIVGFVGFWRYV